MCPPSTPFEQGLRLMGAQQQLAARSLINLIEMISTHSQRYAEQTEAFARDAVELMGQAAQVHTPQDLGELQKKWTDTCVKYGQSQTRATMNFVEQCGAQALNAAAHIETDAAEAKAAATPTPTKDK
ncbi:MAG: phasin [Asticcacaulis sp.]